MERPRLHISAPARVALQSHMAGITEFRPIATVMWANSSVPGWFVGFHDAGKVPADWIVKIDGIDFVLDQGQRSMELDGKTLDFVDNSYVVSDSAI